jgi:cyclopropane fatty-acyl-phospholipid synthase-like methyltransferase
VRQEHWFEPIADHLGAAYLRYSFTKGTEQEVAFLVDELGLEPGHRVLDVGCGPGRHAHALAARGIVVHGIDISRRFVDLATERTPPGAPATFERADARSLAFDGTFDAAISLCQGAFGLVGPGPDEEVLAGMRRALRPGGRVAVSAFSAYFSARYQTEASLDASRATVTEDTEVRDEAGRPKPVQLHTTIYTPRELRLLAERAGLRVDAVHSVEPGAYSRTAPTPESPEFLLTATFPG